jgi:hypothetical protein
MMLRAHTSSDLAALIREPSLRAALGSHQRHVRALGRLGVAVEIEMG